MFIYRNIPPVALLKKNQHGFTLFEVLVAFILAGIMMTGAVFIYRDFVDNWDQDSSRLELQRQGAYALSVMEKVIKQGVGFTIGNYGIGTDNKITVTGPTPGGDAKDIEYYHAGTTIKAKDTQVVTIIPDTHIEGIEVASLKFADDTIVGRSVRIDLKLTDSDGQALDFTSSVRLRNEDIQ